MENWEKEILELVRRVRAQALAEGDLPKTTVFNGIPCVFVDDAVSEVQVVRTDGSFRISLPAPVAEGECCDMARAYEGQYHRPECHNNPCHTPKEVSDSDLDKAVAALPPTEPIEEYTKLDADVNLTIAKIVFKLNQLIRAHNRRIKQ